MKADGRQFAHLGNLYAAAGKDAPRAVRLAVKEVGQTGRTAMRRAVKESLGPQKAIARHINRRVIGWVTSGGAAGASYTVSGRGTIALKHLKTVQTHGGVTVPGIDRDWIGGADRLAKAFEGKSGSSGQRGNAAKRRQTLGGRIVYRSTPARSSLRTVEGLIVAKVFVSARPKAAFHANARKLPPALSRILFAAVEGRLRAHRGRGR